MLISKSALIAVTAAAGLLPAPLFNGAESRTSAPGTMASGPQLPPATVALSLPAESRALDLALALARCTNQHAVLSETTRAVLGETRLAVEGAIDIPPEDVYVFAERLLIHHNVVMAYSQAGGQSMLAFYATSAEALPWGPWTFVGANQFEFMEQHPALLVETVVECKNIDTRQLTTSLRGVLTDARTQSMLSAGERSVVLRGAGSGVRGITRLIHLVDASSHPKPASVPSDKDTPGEAGPQEDH